MTFVLLCKGAMFFRDLVYVHLIRPFLGPFIFDFSYSYMSFCRVYLLYFSTVCHEDKP